MKTENLLWLLVWASLAVVLVIGQYQLKLDRDLERKHSAVMESMIPPSTANVRTR